MDEYQSRWRALKVFEILFTRLLNRQIRRRWLLEHHYMSDTPVLQRFQPVIFLECTPRLERLAAFGDVRGSQSRQEQEEVLKCLEFRMRLLRARVEKGKELAAEIERRAKSKNVKYPTHFCHTCVVSGEKAYVHLTKCGHRICRDCMIYQTTPDGKYQCSICFRPTSILGLRRDPARKRQVLLDR
ncbi:uncharacterized protein BDW43DRAFT_320898 [Aspergillus alliaceus]|uniref:uncharacterized protein n=1 Tax=Petromyces alliaceus TaxID=209559 RepID=UPI0012A72CB8|nr:uncharacterized protein BDW43DRAFT_320898 [Aspergillus alliaceus]KAB8231245.1 hypothetical protein BDW43DRAFT_320898 [Aspergillus alliaceus]